MTTKSFIRSAMKAAEKSLLPLRVGAVIVKSGRIVSKGHNSRRYTNKLLKRKHAESICAEQDAIRHVLFSNRFLRLVGSKIYVARITKIGQQALAKPCKYCQCYLRAVGIHRVFYTDKLEVKELKL